MRASPTPAEESLDEAVLWYELGGLYARAGEDARQASMQGFAVACSVGACVLLSAPLFGTAAWAGPLLAAAVPVAAGLLAMGGFLGWWRWRFSRRREVLRRLLAELGADPDRPAAGGLGAYYDAQLVLLRCEYEFLRSRGSGRALRSARLLETSFGFTPEDGFECGPLNVAPDAEGMNALRGRWERRVSSRAAFGEAPPPVGLREDRAYRVFPREMTVPAELATRSAYLRISCDLFRKRYGKGAIASDEVRRRGRRDLEEYRALVRRG